MRHRRRNIYLLALLYMFPLPGVYAQIVAEICAVNGKVELQRAVKLPGQPAKTTPNQKKPSGNASQAKKSPPKTVIQTRPCRRYDTVQEGDLLLIGPESGVKILFWNNRRVYEVQTPGKVQVKENTLWQENRPLKERQTFSVGFLARLNSAPGLRPEVNGLRLGGSARAGEPLLKPFPVGAVRAPSVTLRWQSDNNAPRSVSVFDRTDKEKVVGIKMTDEQAQNRSFPIPSDLLRPGRIYEWSIIGGKAGCAGIFHVLNEDELRTLKRAEEDIETFERESGLPEVAARLRGQLYEKYDLLDDAMTAYQNALHATPDSAELQQAMDRVTARFRRLTGQEEAKPAGKTPPAL